MSWLDGSSTLFFLSMAILSAELLDEILKFAVALGKISPSEATHICRRWRRYQKYLFKAVKLDPFDENILDLDVHSHLIPYIEELRVGGVVRRSDSSSPPNFYDLSASFTNFLCNITNPSSMTFCDSRIQWANVSSSSIDAFLTVFRRDTFRSLEVSVHKPLPSWMLIRGLCVASELVVHYIGHIVSPPESAELLPYQCSLTRLVLFGNAAVKRTTEFCLEQRGLAEILLQKVVHLVLEYGETDASLGPPIAPYAEILVAFLGSQLEALDIRVISSCKQSFFFTHACPDMHVPDTPPPAIPQSALRHLKSLRRLSIYLTGCSAGSNDTLTSATEYMESILSSLPFSSLVQSLSLRIDDRRELDPGADDCESKYQNLLLCICEQLSCAKKWPLLTASHILVDVNDDNFTKPLQTRGTINTGTTSLEIDSLLQVNISKAENFSSLVIPQMG
jgi:hypothetical protein